MSLSFFPVLVTYNLDISKNEILSKIYESLGYTIFEEFSYSNLVNFRIHRKMFINLNWDKIMQISEWNLPTMIFTDRKEKHNNFIRNLLELQMSHVVFLGSPVEWNLSNFYIKKEKKVAFIVLKKFSQLIKRLLEFSGFNVIISNDLETIIFSVKEHQLWEKILILIDLDHEKIDILYFLENLFNLMKQNYIFDKVLQLFLIKDIETPLQQLDWNILIYQLKKLNSNIKKIKRLYEIEEIIIMILESLYFQKILFEDWFILRELRDLNDYEFHKKWERIQKIMEFNKQGKEVEPVLWLYEYFLKNHEFKTLVLKDYEEIQ